MNCGLPRTELGGGATVLLFFLPSVPPLSKSKLEEEPARLDKLPEGPKFKLLAMELPDREVVNLAPATTLLPPLRALPLDVLPLIPLPVVTVLPLPLPLLLPA